MSRPLWSRVLAIFVGFWFVAVAAGPELTHACPTHGSHAVQSSAHASHGASSQSREPTKGSQCTCLGQCCSTAPLAVASAPIALTDVPTVAARDAGLPDYAYVPVAADHVLPPANGPPLSA
jgi:hypothetical protein